MIMFDPGESTYIVVVCFLHKLMSRRAPKARQVAPVGMNFATIIFKLKIVLCSDASVTFN